MNRPVQEITIDKIKFLESSWPALKKELGLLHQVELYVGDHGVKLRGKSRFLPEAEATLNRMIDRAISDTIPCPLPLEVLSLVKLSDENEELFRSMGLILIRNENDYLVIAEEEALK